MNSLRNTQHSLTHSLVEVDIAVLVVCCYELRDNLAHGHHHALGRHSLGYMKESEGALKPRGSTSVYARDHAIISTCTHVCRAGPFDNDSVSERGGFVEESGLYPGKSFSTARTHGACDTVARDSVHCDGCDTVGLGAEYVCWVGLVSFKSALDSQQPHLRFIYLSTSVD